MRLQRKAVLSSYTNPVNIFISFGPTQVSIFQTIAKDPDVLGEQEDLIKSFRKKMIVMLTGSFYRSRRMTTTN